MTITLEKNTSTPLAALKRAVLIVAFVAPLRCDAFSLTGGPSFQTTQLNLFGAVSTQAVPSSTEKADFLESLESPFDLNPRSEGRTNLLNALMDGGGSFANPGSKETFELTAPGVWRVVYAPHMTIMAGLFQGKFSVQYDLRDDGTMTSHAKYNFPLLNLWGYLSVSGTYGSVNRDVCRVDFNEAWIKILDDDTFAEGPFPTIDSVPDSFAKSIIRNIGRLLFIEPFAIFPVSYLDNDLIVFDFELLGTRICARKEP